MLRPETGRIRDLLPQLADIVDRVVRRRIHLDHVERCRRRDRNARVTDSAGRDRRSLLAVQACREDLRHARLAGAAGADEQVGVVDVSGADGVGQRAHHVFLADDIRERPRTVATVERGAGGHGLPSLERLPATSVEHEISHSRLCGTTAGTRPVGSNAESFDVMTRDGPARPPHRRRRNAQRGRLAGQWNLSWTSARHQWQRCSRRAR